MKSANNGRWIAGTALLCLTLIAATVVLSRPMPRSYAFVPDHPVQMWQIGTDRWAYYSTGPGESADLAKRVRPQLLKEGYREDATQRPWFRFLKGDREVVVCDHGEFASGTDRSGKVVLTRVISTGDANRWTSVLVKNGPERRESMRMFQVKKLLHGW